MTKIALAPIAHTNKRTSYLFAGFGAGVIGTWLLCSWLGWIPRDGLLLVLWMCGATGVGMVGVICAGFVMDSRFECVDDSIDPLR